HNVRNSWRGDATRGSGDADWLCHWISDRVCDRHTLIIDGYRCRSVGTTCLSTSERDVTGRLRQSSRRITADRSARYTAAHLCERRARDSQEKEHDEHRQNILQFQHSSCSPLVNSEHIRRSSCQRHKTPAYKTTYP